MAQLAVTFEFTGFDNPTISGRKSLVSIAKDEINTALGEQANVILAGKKIGGTPDTARAPSLRSTVRTWSKPRPSFTYARHVSGGNLSIKVSVGGDKARRWLAINDGTKGGSAKSYQISPIKSKTLALPAIESIGKFKPKTSPNVRGSKAGVSSVQLKQKYGYNRTGEVTHSGITARNFTVAAQEAVEKSFPRAMQKALDKVARRANKK